MMKTKPCTCGDARAYEVCCGKFHAGDAAPTPLALMRARYSAYAMGRNDYVLATWHASTRPTREGLGDDIARWIRLEIKSHNENGDEGFVEFVAVSKLNGRAHRMHERSRFVREHGQWFYVSGEVKP